MNNIFDITAFGAVGDGVTDCTAAIQQAFDAAAQCRGQVTVPPGIYATGRVHLHGISVCLKGSSGWGYRVDGCSVLKLNDPAADCLLDISAAVGCTVQGLSLIGEEIGENVHGIMLRYDQYNGNGQEDTPSIDDCRVARFTGDGIRLEKIWAFTVRHCMMIYNKGAGLYIDGWDGFISDSIFCANGNCGILGGPTCSAITLTCCRIEWNSGGGVLFPYGCCCNITGNYFDRTFGPAITLGTADGFYETTTVTGNVFQRNGAYTKEQPLPDSAMGCHVRLIRCKGVTVSGNTARVAGDDGPGGINTPDIGFLVENCAECIIKDNTMFIGAVRQLIDLHGDNSTCLIKDNIGSLFKG